MKTVSASRIAPTITFASLFLFCAGCANVVYQPQGSQVGTPKMTAAQARRQLKQSLQATIGGVHKQIHVNRDGFEYEITYTEGSPLHFSYQFHNLNKITVVEQGTFWISQLQQDQQVGGYTVPGQGPMWNNIADAKACADALHVLILNSEEGNTEDINLEQFKQKAAAWRALATKPPLPDEAHKYQVLAAAAVQEKRFEDAAEYYEQGLEIVPLWPDAQHDAAMIDGELGNYRDAADHMRCYVELIPDASDAEAARNQVIIWDEKAKNPPTRSGQNFPTEPENTKK